MATRKTQSRPVPRTTARETRGAAPLTTFRIPEPKGPRVSRESIPKSTLYVPPTDPEEAAAFGSGNGNGGAPRGRRRRDHEDEALTAAQRRMLGRRATVDPDEDDEEPENEPEPDDDDEAYVEGLALPVLTEPAPTPMNRAPVASPFGTPTPVAEAPFDPRVFATSSPIYTRPIGLADTDRLWDWIRTDNDRGKAFLGQTFESSVALHTFMGRLSQAEQHGIAVVRAIGWDDAGTQTVHHFGFVVLSPILTDARTALVHIYLREDQRNHLAQFVGPLVEIAAKVMPGFHLAVASPSPAFVRLHRAVLAPLGFTEHVLFVK